MNFISMFDKGATAVLASVTEVPKPTVSAPKDLANDITTLLNWAMWGFSAACILGFIIAAGKMALSHHQGTAEGGIGRVGWVAIACIIGSASSQIVKSFLQ